MLKTTFRLVLAVLLLSVAGCASNPFLPQPTPSLPPEDLSAPGPFATDTTFRFFSRTLADGSGQQFATSIWYPTNTGSPATAHPLIVFSHGDGGTPNGSSQLLKHLASYGFVVAAPQHADCKGACSSDYKVSESILRRQDVETVVDSLLTLSDGQDPQLADIVDPYRIGLVGWSFGGTTALRAEGADPRFKAAVLLAPGLVGALDPTLPPGLAQGLDPAQVSTPLMLIDGRLDGREPFQWTETFYAGIPASAPDHWLLGIQRAGHSFGDDCISQTSPDGYPFAFAACDALLPQSEVNAIVAQWSTAFLLRYVAGDDRNAAALDPASNANGDVAVVRTASGSPPEAIDPPADPQALVRDATALVCQMRSSACSSLQSGLKVEFTSEHTGTYYDVSSNTIRLDSIFRYIRVDGVAAALIGGASLAAQSDSTCDAIGRRETAMAQFWQAQYPNATYPLETVWDWRMRQIVRALGPGDQVQARLDPSYAGQCHA